MFDSVDPALFPDPAVVHFDATAGYVNGRYPSSAGILKRFPNLPHVSISVTSTGVADACDVEAGDLTPDQVPGWIDNYWNRRHALPVVYGSDPAIRTAVGSRPYLAWNANWTYKPHIDDGYQATQWTDPPAPQGTAPAGTLKGVDQTLMTDRFFYAIGGTVATTLTADDLAAIAKAVLETQFFKQPGNVDPTSLKINGEWEANQFKGINDKLDAILAAVKALPVPPTTFKAG